MNARYPIGKMILEALEARDMTRPQLVKALGYANINKGLRKVDACIRGEGGWDSGLVGRIASTLEIAGDDLKRAVGDTEAMLRAEEEERQRVREQYERKMFKPYLYFRTKRDRPAFITGVAVTGVAMFKHLYLPEDIASLPEDEEIRAVGEIIRGHYPGGSHTRSMFGDITGYVYRRTYDESMEFSSDGKLLEKGLGRIREGRAVLLIGKKTVEGGLFRDRS